MDFDKKPPLNLPTYVMLPAVLATFQQGLCRRWKGVEKSSKKDQMHQNDFCKMSEYINGDFSFWLETTTGVV